MGYRLQVLGSVGLLREGETESILSMGKPLALIAYLAFSPRRTASREHLVDLLWADADPDSARRNLRQALYHIRRLTGAEFIVAEAESLRLGTDLRSDAATFLAAIERGDLPEAIDAYPGPFFPAFAAPGGAEFERWADLERRRLHTTYLRALEALTREALQRHRLREAEALARRMRDEAPEREVGWRLLIEALISAEDWVRAAAEADACEDWMARDGSRPEPATISALHAARQAPALSPGPTRIVAEMVGREREFARIAAAWDTATGGHFVHAHVIGAAGIGKTRLLRDAAARITASGGLVVSIRANPGERHLSYALAGDLTRQLSELPGAPGIAPATAGVLVGLDPALSARFPAAQYVQPMQEDLLRVRGMALTDMIDAVAADRPLAILVDDLHWSDGESRQLISALAARLRATATLLVTSQRPVPDAQVRTKPEDTITLRPLTPKQIETLLESIAAIPSGLLAAGLVDTLHEVTGGSPLLVLEALQHGSDRELLVREDGEWVAPNPPALLHLLAEGEGLAHRIAALPTAERRILLAVAVAGAPVPDRVLSALTRQQESTEAPPVQSLERRGFLVRRNDGGWECAHDLIAETLVESASRDETRHAHAALGEHLLTSAPDERESVRAALQHLALGGADEPLRRALVTYVRLMRADGDQRGARALAEAVLANTLAPNRITSLVRTLPPQLRIARRLWIAIGAAAATVLAAVAVWWLSQPVALVVTQAPDFIEEVSPGHPIVVHALNRIGIPAYPHGDTVRARIAEPLDDYPFVLAGDTTAVVRAGHARFERLHLRWEDRPSANPPGAVQLEFAIDGLSSVRTDSLVSGIAATGVYLDSAILNDQRLVPEDRTVRVRLGERITGRVHIHYRTNIGTAAFLLAAVPNWGDRTWNHGAAYALESRTIRDSAVVQIDFAAPDRPGRYWIAFVGAAETEARFIASGTNWTLVTPVWHDGNDIVDMGPDEIQALETKGTVMWQMLIPGPSHSMLNRVARPVPPEEADARLRLSDRSKRQILGTVIHVVAE